MYTLNKPYTKEERAKFIVKYNHNMGLTIEETETGLIAKEYEPSKEDIINAQIAECKARLAESDYKCLKFVDGALSEEEYAEVKAERQALRDKINELEAELNPVEDEPSVEDDEGEE